MLVNARSSSDHCSCTKQLDISHLSFDGAREAIDKRIQELQASIRRLHEQRNKLTSISRLPSELLILIFKHAISDSDEPYYTERSYYFGGGACSAPRWKRFCAVTQVCRQWRAIALAHSDFWSRIIFETPAIAEAMLHGSKETPLYIRLSNSVFMQMAKQSLQGKIMDMSRLAELHVELESYDLQSLFSLATRHTAGPILRSLQIHRTANYSAEPYTIPSFIFSSMRFPHLRHLDITDCELDWNALDFGKQTFNNLISLKFKNISPPSRKQFYSFLSHTPELETLVIDGSALPPSANSFSQASLVQNVLLPKLCSCTLQNIALVDCVDFQDLVIYPATKAQLKFELVKERIQHPTNALADNTFLIDRLLTSCGLSKDSSPKRTHKNLLLRNSSFPIPGGVTNGLGIILWDGHLTNATDHSLHHGAVADPQVEITFLKYIKLSTLSIPGVEQLAIRNVISQYSRKDWYAFFKNHDRISQMYIDSSDLLPITTVISTPARTKIGYRLCLPKLRMLTLTSHCRHMTRVEEEYELNGLIDCVIARCNFHVPLQTLNLVECYLLSNKDVALLKDIVVNVDWDGIRLGFDDEDDEDDTDKDNSDEADEDDHYRFSHEPYDSFGWSGDEEGTYSYF